MCKPTELLDEAPKRVVIAGAGPAGLLLTALLLKRNEDPPTCKYHVTLIDAGQDLGSISKEDLSKNHRSWMLGLANHGLDALREIPELYDECVNGIGIRLETFNIYLGAKKIENKAGDENKENEAYIVDRNHIVAAIARYVKDQHEHDENFLALYQARCQYVDHANKQVLVRDNKTEKERYCSYDLLVGCDGIRSVVREAFIKRHTDFEVDVGDIFQKFKAVHVKRPEGLSAAGMSILPDVFPYCQGIALPETGDLVNISIGCGRHHFDVLPEELKSSNFQVVSDYFKKNFRPFELVDYEDYAKQWVGQTWNRTGMVHCNFYHSEDDLVIMGDAAHATSPTIGMGMNQALKDAQVFHNLLKENKDCFSKTLPDFSKARVKEGNSLSDLAIHLYCLDKFQMTIETIHMLARSALSSSFPSLVSPHPQAMIGVKNVALSDVYDHAMNLGILQKHRSINDRIRREYFESSVGMVKKTKNRGWLRVGFAFVTSGALLAVGVKFLSAKLVC